MNICSTHTTVLLIDPKEQECQLWGERLKICSNQYRVLHAHTGEMGLAIYSSEPVDCVVLELQLPHMSGFQVLLRLNPIVHRSLQTPVVVLSHFTLPSVVQAAKKLGAQGYLTKSQTSGDDLDRAIRKAIETIGPTRKELCMKKTNQHD